MARRFNRRERAALFLAADGHCERCGTELQPGWHADHTNPYSAGGPTDVTNGQALCPACNLKKGTNVIKPRGWQEKFATKYHLHAGSDFLCVACPGAGKTLASALVAADLLREGVIDRILIVAPSAPLRQQWANAFGKLGIIIDANTMNDQRTRENHQHNWVGERDRQDGKLVRGWVVTYASLAANPAYHRILNSRKRTLAILDEVHHLGDQAAWGDAAQEALNVCVRRLHLSGTPFRHDGAHIPFVTYHPNGHPKAGYPRFADDEQLGPFPGGFDYSYGKALADKPAPVRPIVFEMFDGDVSWFDAAELQDRNVRLSDKNLGRRLRGKANRMALNASGQWLAEALTAADNRLSALREEGDPQAKGLVVCIDTEHADAVAKVLAQVTGVSVPIAVSTRLISGVEKDVSEQARKTIGSFGGSDKRWLVAVAMVSEGVDIPQLRVGVYATNKRTELFFRQVIGRFVRKREDLPDDVDQTAHLFVPKEPVVMELAEKVTDEVGGAIVSRDVEDEGEAQARSGAGGQRSLFADTFQESTGEAAGFLLPGAGQFGQERAEKLAAESGYPVAIVLGVMQAQERLGFGGFGPGQAAATVPQQRSAEPFEQRQKARRDALSQIVKQVAGRRLQRGGGKFGEHATAVWAEIYDGTGIPKVGRADVPELDKAITYAREMWKRS